MRVSFNDNEKTNIKRTNTTRNGCEPVASTHQPLVSSSLANPLPESLPYLAHTKRKKSILRNVFFFLQIIHSQSIPEAKHLLHTNCASILLQNTTHYQAERHQNPINQ